VSELPKPGRYRHYKRGDEYTVIDIVFHSETDETMVLYRAEYGERRLWVRPAEMFLEWLELGDTRVQRFCYIENQHCERDRP